MTAPVTMRQIDASFTGSRPNFFKNNIVYTTNSQAVIEGNTNLAMDNNLYFAKQGTLTWKYQGTSYNRFDAYVNASKQDQHGLNADPQLVDPTYHSPGRPDKAFRLQHASIAMNAGTDVCAGINGCTMGGHDFFGHPLSKQTSHNIGADESK